jgi:hypothetical protein
MSAEDFYRKLNTDNDIPDLQQDVLCYSPDQMIWFAEKYAKFLHEIPDDIFEQVLKS